MVNENLIPKENIAKIEEVRELKETEQERLIRENYEAEFDSCGDLSVGRSYGPGNSQSYNDNSEKARMSRHAGKTVVGLTTSITSKVAGPAGPVINGTVGAITTVVGKIGESFSDDDAWKYTSELGQDMIKGAVIGNLIDTNIAPVFEGSSCGLVREGWEMWKDFDERGGKDRLMMSYHDFHRTNGENYSNYCDVCKS